MKSWPFVFTTRFYGAMPKIETAIGPAGLQPYHDVIEGTGYEASYALRTYVHTSHTGTPSYGTYELVGSVLPANGHLFDPQ